ncbi:hypothetical protein CASFOL_027163 [Castilleja foliolosa]|uniref:SAM domain-containing protein n=1 Tax=Castilleja foliolosa TaxID=1961234 RepID=A0ABD3CF37_9LAMI
MVKQKQRHTHHVPSKKPQNKGSVNPPDEEDWTLVKKQKITILIPPLPNEAVCSMPSVGEGKLQDNLRNTNSQSPKSLHEAQKSKSLSTKRDIHPPILHSSKPLRRYGEGRGDKGIMLFSDNCGFLDRRMRASYLDKKLKNVGGLENWLVSLGLGHFVKIFRTRSVSKFQLANLTMKKLKDMGIVAVGPRRKLIHAIDCLCEPHCFQHV